MSSDTIGENKKVNKFKSPSQYDATYDPKKPAGSDSQYVTSEVKERLYAICPAPKRCMVTLESAENSPIEICHILAHQTKPGFLRILQEHWAMKNPLDVNIPENLIFMRVDMHRAFDRGDWALFPEVDLLGQIGPAYTKNAERVSQGKRPINLFQKFKTTKGGKPFKYRLVWLKDIDASTNPPILRRRLPSASTPVVMPENDITNPATTNKVKELKKRDIATLEAEIAALQLEITALRERRQDNHHINQGMTTRSKSARFAQEYIDSILPDHQLYQPPYTDFPTMESHVHPLFVIYNAGDKLRGCANLTNLDRGIEFNLAALNITYLYNLWSKQLQLVNKPHDNGDKDDGGEGGDDSNSDGDDGNDSEDDGEDDGNDSEGDGEEDGEDEGREDDHDDNASDKNSDDQDERGHGGNSPKSREHAEKHGKPQGIQDAAELSRNHSTRFDTSTGTPELVGDDSRQGSVKPTDTEGSNARHDSDTSDYGDLDRWIAEWAASAEPESNIKLLTNDHQLRRYKKEPARKPPFEQWQHWAHSPPDLPMTIRDTDDTSHYTSYLWALYCEDSNLLAPDGSPYRVPKPWNQYRS